MKKSLLLATMLLAGSSAFAAKDAATYEPVDGYTLTNLWVRSQFIGTEDWNALPIPGPNYARTSAIYGDKVYIAQSKKTGGDGLVDEGSLIELDFMTGEVVRTIDLTIDGAPMSGLLCANQVVADDFGHLLVGSYIASSFVAANPETGAEAHANPIKIYDVDLTNGACTLVAELGIPEDEAEANVTGRIDYFDVIGDITGAKAPATVMCAIASGQTPAIYGWRLEQGETEWHGHLAGGEYVADYMREVFPADQTQWGTAPFVRILKDEEFSGELFYVDGNTTVPSLYNTEGTMIESFASVETELWPSTGANGVGEFSIGGDNFVAYVEGQYDAPHSCQVYICKLGENSSFEGMQKMYLFPTEGLGQTSDAGNRIHSIATKVVTDENGKEGAYVLTHKCANGIGVYLFAQEGFQSGVKGVEVVEENAPVEYFNLQGVRVANPENGLYIRRQGAKAEKVVL